MGTNIEIHLFKPATFSDTVLPAVQGFRERGDPTKLAQALKLVARSAPEVLPPRDMLEVERDPEIARMKAAWEKEADPGRKDMLWKAYWRRSLQILGLRDAPDVITAGEALRLAALLEAGRALDSELTSTVRDEVIPALVQVLCIPWSPGTYVLQDLRNSPLHRYLASRSEFFELAFACVVHGPTLEISFGESTDLFSREDVQCARAELDRLKRPRNDAWAEAAFDALCTMVDRALGESDTALAITVT